jgi:hypothetical protein
MKYRLNLILYMKSFELFEIKILNKVLVKSKSFLTYFNEDSCYLKFTNNNQITIK